MMKILVSFSHSPIVLYIFLSSIMIISKVSCLIPKFQYPTENTATNSEYINKSCATTLYPNLCYKSLAIYSNKIKTDPKLLAAIALRVAINRTSSTSRILRNLTRARGLKTIEHVAIVECVDEVSDSLYELQKSMKLLNHSTEGFEFVSEMNDIQTWVSAALTDDDTCMDDFTSGKFRVFVRILILRIAHLTSIALAFINSYAQL